jgi:hypothetical protein
MIVPPPEPPPDLRDKVFEAIGRSPALLRRQVRLNEFGLLTAAGIRTGPRPTPLIIATAVGSATIAAASLWVAVARGKSMVGRPRAWLLATIVLAPACYLAWKVASTAPFPVMSDRWPGRVGLKCFGLCLLFSVPPLATLFYLRRGSDPVHPQALGAAYGAAVGACATLLVDLWCPVAYVPHLLLGHTLPVALLSLIGAWLGHRFLTIRPQ